MCECVFELLTVGVGDEDAIREVMLREQVEHQRGVVHILNQDRATVEMCAEPLRLLLVGSGLEEGIRAGLPEGQGSLFDFGDAIHRITASSPHQYMSNSVDEFLDYQNAVDYYDTCSNLLGPSKCYLRILDQTDCHATGCSKYVFGQAGHNDTTEPPATPGTTLFQDTIAFANQFVTH